MSDVDVPVPEIKLKDEETLLVFVKRYFCLEQLITKIQHELRY